MTVQSVTLSSPPGSILTHDREFRKLPGNDSDHIDNYALNVQSRHNLEIGNMSNDYHLNVVYTDPKNPPISFISFNTTNNTVTTVTSVSKNGTSQNSSWTFNWPIRTMDLTTLTYFWIVLIGVILSKLSTRITSTRITREKAESPIGSLSKYDYLWIGISAIIALLIISSFQQ
jgi:hypothetical protein